MGHLPATSLVTWKPGDKLSAQALNQNFLAILALLEALAREIRTPDPVVVALENRVAALERRAAGLEQLTSLHARQRNEREYAPLAHLGALVQMVNDAYRHFGGVAKRVEDEGLRVGLREDDLDRRLARLEQQPEFATQEAFAPVAKEYERIALKENMLLAQVIALRHEVRIVTELAVSHDRLANRKEYAPLSMIGHLLQRIKDIEARL